ncbi:MAG: hypothetical protein ISR76_00630 [Planctomycetes bacterium]|nr:hypothetical protein [Planctomycetota bacterium]MBL7007476.1 hypothetical protein [Planctomycetota bacterium]
MQHSSFYTETKYCPKCDDYVRFLQSVQACYCVECGSRVHLFSLDDRKAFLQRIKEERAAKNDGHKRVS